MKSTPANLTLVQVFQREKLSKMKNTTTMKLEKPYLPKPIKGQTVKGYIKVSTAQVKRLFQNGQTFNGFIVGNKVSAFHFFGGWHLAFPIEKSTWAEFEQTLIEWAWYNANPETGNIPAIYFRKPRKAPTVFLPSLPLLVA